MQGFKVPGAALLSSRQMFASLVMSGVRVAPAVTVKNTDVYFIYYISMAT